MSPRHLVSIALVATMASASGMATAQQAPPGVQVSGVFVTVWGSGQATLTLMQTGPNVVGTFTNPPGILPGAVAGVVRGNVLTGRWTDARTTGGLSLTFAADGSSFTGTWGRLPDSTASGGPWTGNRQ